MFVGTDLADMRLISKCNKEFVFYYLFLILKANMPGLFLWKIKKVLQLLILFKNFRWV